jgi:hypothetical protein
MHEGWVEIATTDSLIHLMIVTGAISALFGALMAWIAEQLRGTTGEWLGNLVALGAAWVGITFAVCNVLPGIHGYRLHVPLLLPIAVGCYLPASAASGHLAHLRWLLLALIWLGLSGAAVHEVSAWGGLARFTLLDLTLFGALLAPPALAFAKRP